MEVDRDWVGGRGFLLFSFSFFTSTCFSWGGVCMYVVGCWNGNGVCLFAWFKYPWQNQRICCF